MDKIQRFPSRLLKLNSLIKKSEWLGESGTFRVRTILKLKMCKIQWFLLVNLWGQVITLRGQILVSRKLAIRDDTRHSVEMQNKCQKTLVLPMKTPLPPCVHSNTSPYVRSKRPSVYRHHAHMFQHVCALCRHTRGRLNVHTEAFFFKSPGVFSAFHTTPQHCTHHTDHTPHHDTRHNTTRRQTETDRDRERRQRQREKRKRKRRRQDKSREKTEV